MCEIRMPYGRTGGWFVRMPCYLRATPSGNQLKIEVASRLTDREVHLAVYAGDVAAGSRMFQSLSSIYDSRAKAGFDGVDSRTGRRAVVVYARSVAVKNGIEILDVQVPGGGISVETEDN